MKNILYEVKRHFIIYSKFVKNCIIKEMMYRANFCMMLAIETAFLLTKLLYVLVVYNTGANIKGFTPDDILLFSGTYILISGVHVSLFFFNFSKIQEYIKEGSLDMFITKPVSLQFMVTLRNIDFGTAIPNIIAGIICIVIGWQRTGVPCTAQYILGYIGFIFTGIIMAYTVTLLPELLCFWTIKGNAVHEVSDALWGLNSMPMTIYKRWMQAIGTIIFPIFLIGNLSPMYVLDKVDNIGIIWGICSPIIFMIIVRFVWKLAIKNYASASS